MKSEESEQRPPRASPNQIAVSQLRPHEQVNSETTSPHFQYQPDQADKPNDHMNQIPGIGGSLLKVI